MASSRTVTTTYKNWRIKSSPFSHLGTRMYEAGIFGSAGLADIAHGKDRMAVIANAQKLIDDHVSGERLLHNVGLDPAAWRDVAPGKPARPSKATRPAGRRAIRHLAQDGTRGSADRDVHLVRPIRGGWEAACGKRFRRALLSGDPTSLTLTCPSCLAHEG